MIDLRERLFRRHRLDGMPDLRAAHAAGRLAGLPTADVVLILDGFGQLNGEFEELEPMVHAVLARGGSFGVHLVATARRVGEIRMAQQVAFGGRLELRLADPGESSVDSKLARGLPADIPGRALAPGGPYAQVALPRIDGIDNPETSGEALVAAAATVRAGWPGPPAPAVRVLPTVLRLSALPRATVDDLGVPFGLEENAHAPVALDLFGRDQHLLVLGDSGCGKSNLLQVVAHGLMDRHPDSDLVFAVFDPRRGMAGAVDEPWLGGYAPSALLANRLAGAVCQQLTERVGAAPGVSSHLPRIVLLIDDYDVLVAGGTQPLAPLIPYVSAGRDLGVHVVMCRRVLGAARGLFEPFTSVVRESGCAALVMSGDRSEGQLFPGVRPSVLPAGRGLLVRHGDPVRTVQVAQFEASGGQGAA